MKCVDISHALHPFDVVIYKYSNDTWDIVQLDDLYCNIRSYRLRHRQYMCDIFSHRVILR
jgi:hypothetical protein